MAGESGSWEKNRLETVALKERRQALLVSVALLFLGPSAGYIGFAMFSSWIPIYAGLVLGIIGAVLVLWGNRRVAGRNPVEVALLDSEIRLRSSTRGDWSLPWERIHTVWRRLPDGDIVVYFNSLGWLRSFSVDKELGDAIDRRFTQLELEQGPFPKPPVTFRPVVTIPWLVSGPAAIALGLPLYSAGLEGVDRWLGIWGLFGLMGGFAMLLYGLLTLVWFLRERGRRERGEAKELLFAGLE